MKKENAKWLLAAGDLLAILIAVVLGFQFHESGTVLAERLPFTLLPWWGAWLAVGLSLELFKIKRNFTSTFLRVLWGMALASSLAALLRSAWLGGAALPIFALIMGLSSALAILVWRFIAQMLPMRSGENE